MTSSTYSYRRPHRMRGGLRDALVLAGVAAATTWFALLSWKGFALNWGGFMGPLVLVAIVVAASGGLLRWLRVPGPLVVLAQLAIVGVVVCLQLTGSPLPLGDSWTQLQQVFSDASASAQAYRAPVPRGVPPIDPLLISGGAACLVLVDIAVGTLRRVPLAGLPLLTIYSVPVSLLGGGVSLIVFTVTAIGFLLMLYLQESRQIARWGRPLGQDVSSDPSGFGVSNGALRSSAGAIGGVATALAIVVPLFVPTFGLHLFSNGFGPGDGDQVKIVNPMTDLKRDLQRGRDVDMITVTTTDPDPSYLRIAVLNRFSDNEWTSGNRKAPTDQRAFGEMPPIAGLDPATPRKTYDYNVSIGQAFQSTWLPTQAPISRINAAGDWRYDTSTMDFMSFDQEHTNAQGETYTMTAVKPQLDPDELNSATSSTALAGTEFTDLPEGLPDIVTQEALAQTADYTTKYEKAVALQNWFRDNFDYSLQTVSGNGTDALEAFLTEGKGGRTGYCEQFASAMAVMARTLNIPARVAVGFLSPQLESKNPDGRSTWVYSAWDMHAWPELYFPGAGRVRFEPTPPTRPGGTEAPSYTDIDLTANPVDDLPSTAATTQDIENRPDLNDPKDKNPQDQASSSDGSGFDVPWRALVIGIAVLAVLIALLMVPRLVRRRRRESRLVDGPEPIWIELRDTVVDLGLTWPLGRSPRETGSYLVHYFGRPPGEDTATRPRHGVDVSPEAEVALDRIVGTIEHARYAPPGREQAAILKADAETVITALVGGVPVRARRRADWFPRSLMVSRRRPSSAPTPTDDTRYGGVVDHVG
jgi:transglutaminase-like putative cysteine protease